LVCFQSNVLIDGNNKAVVADFGLSNIVIDGPSYVTSSIGGSVRWAAPEHFRLLEDSCVSTVTTYGDIYSYGSVMLQVRAINTMQRNSFWLTINLVDVRQVLSGKLPYHHLLKDAEVLINLHHGVHPPRPAELLDEYWALISRCWAKDPCTRPAITEISKCIQHHYRALSTAPDDCVVPSTSLNNGVVDSRTSYSTLALVFVFAKKVLSYIIG
jgi:serine/threonine protein kinase